MDMQLLLSASKSVDVVHLAHISLASCISAAGNLCGGNTAVFPFCATRITQRKGSEEYVIQLKLQRKFRKKEKHLSWNIATSRRLTPYFCEKCCSHNDKKVVKSSCFIERKAFQFNFYVKKPKFRAMLLFLGT